MIKYTFVCHSCSDTLAHDSEKNQIAAALEIGWGTVFDTSNGLSQAHYCVECFNKAKELAKELKNIVKLNHFHFNNLVDE